MRTIRFSTNSNPLQKDSINLEVMKDSFFQFSNAQRNTLAALENFLLRNMERKHNSVIIGCPEAFLAIHSAKYFTSVMAVDANPMYLAEILIQQPHIVACQIETDNFTLTEPVDLILVPHLLQTWAAWLESIEERNHQRLAFIANCYGSLQANGGLVLLQTQAQNNYQSLLEHMHLTPSLEANLLYEQIRQQFDSDCHSYLFPIEIHTHTAEDMVMALGYLLNEENIDWTDKLPMLQTYAQTLKQAEDKYYFNYESQMIVLRMKAE